MHKGKAIVMYMVIMSEVSKVLQTIMPKEIGEFSLQSCLVTLIRLLEKR